MILGIRAYEAFFFGVKMRRNAQDFLRRGENIQTIQFSLKK